MIKEQNIQNKSKIKILFSLICAMYSLETLPLWRYKKGNNNNNNSEIFSGKPILIVSAWVKGKKTKSKQKNMTNLIFIT
jgi:hypothetical protein